MKTFIKPKKLKRMNKKMTYIMMQELSRAKKAPIKQLEIDAKEFEKLVLSRRAMG